MHILVVKAGTRILVKDDGTVNHRRMNNLVKELCQLKQEGRSIVLVSSGAVGLGMGVMGLKRRPTALAVKQASAATGQIKLMEYYSGKFRRHGQQVAQVLLSGEDFRERTRYNNIKRTIEELFKHNIIPIINENDTICTEEIKVGDNDKLCADVAHFLEADLLILLSDARGLYTKNPAQYPDAQRIPVVHKITPKIESLGGGAGSLSSVGGMRAKLKAIKQATEAGTPVMLTDGKRLGLSGLLAGPHYGTLFLPAAHRLKGRKRWLAFVSKARGKLFLDEGGTKALAAGRSSVLAAGITKIQGCFANKDLVDIANKQGKVIGRGRVSYSHDEIQKVIGKKSKDFYKVLKRKGPEEIIHRDNLVIYQQ
ncbi:MAG: glutamate 5-kinase [Fibrobacteria bacterium]|nr:glutamate 5-kinase [Fibrobacteria bacterium]